MLETFLRPAVIAPVIALVGYVLYQLLQASKLPALPVVGAQPREWFPLLRARWRNAKNIESAVSEAYEKYKNQACILPVAGANDFVLLPIQEMQWLIDQPDSNLNMHQQVVNDLQLRLTVTDTGLDQPPLHHDLISQRLTREVGNLVPELIDEIGASVDDIWGTHTGQPQEVCVYTSMQRVIGRATNRIFIGLPMCRDPNLLKYGIAYAQDVPLTSTILRFIWKPLRPLVALVITLPNRFHTRKFYSILRPEIERRLRRYDARRADTEKQAADKEPNDFLQWSIIQAKARGDPYTAKVDTLAGRVLMLNFASIHTSSFAITHVLLDLASSKQEYIDELRDEISRVLAAHDGQWNKRALAEMPKLDSVMRESQRLNSFVVVATMRMVANKDGIKTPSGVHLAPGTSVSQHAYSVLHDPDIYPDPDEFIPFRFAEKRAAQSEGTYVERARQAFATTSGDYLAFGHGRHACPGRFFASSELKLLLAYLVMNYDFEFQDKRPENWWFGLNRVPPMKATLRIQRRAIKG